MGEFTQEEVEAKIAEAVAAATDPLKNRIAELETAAQETEVGQAVAEAVAAKDTEISELQSKLDEAVAAKTAAESKLGETEQFWADAIAAHQEQEAFAARRAERIAKAKEAGIFEDEYLEEHADRFAAMDQEDFDARLAEWQLIAERSGTSTSPAPSAPKPTAMQATRTPDGAKGSALALIGELRGARGVPSNL